MPSTKKPTRKLRTVPVQGWGKGKSSLTKVIKKVLSSQVEDKYCAIDMLNNVLFNSAVTTPSELYPCLPAIEKGDDSWQRNGQEVAPKHLRIRGTIALADDVLTADIVAYMYVFTTKKFKYIPEVVSLFVPTSMLTTGQGGTTNPTGTALVSMYKEEKEQITLLNKKQFHLMKGYGSQNGGSTGDTGVGGSANTLRMFDIKIKCPAKFKFDENNGPRYPTNFAPVVCFGYYHTDGTVPDSLNRALNVNMSCQLTYEDA